ncbi:MAG: galactosyldiacylglycerol synthase [Oscillospiraceae bacterium]|jgi:processive 1,2-diacylglycerol beta-glucosyltransferase|nr:galactosyldiacylglycerol synthase [Oscillospiraceae bacterium]
MHVLIVSVTAGNGHNAAGEAIAQQFRDLSLTTEIEIVQEDLYEYCGQLFYQAMDKGYVFLTRYLPEMFGSAYDQLDSSASSRRIGAVVSASAFITKRFKSYFRDSSPDVIIATHVFAANVLSELKESGQITAPIIGILTDYCIHPYWEDCAHIDYLVTPDECLSYSAERKGMAVEKLLPFGIPVREKFLTSVDALTARRTLGLDEKLRTVLVMGGSMGFGEIAETVDDILELDEDYQVVVICGNNHKLFDDLIRRENDNLRVLGFIDNVDQYMDASDVIVTKPGGLTATELLVKNLPAIIINPIPGPETRNLEFLRNSGCVLYADKRFPVSEALRLLFKTPERAAELKKAAKRIAKPNAAKDICEFAKNLTAHTEHEGKDWKL